ncbi:MAG: hypothetical protein LBK47_08740 [Prevotellaceae bacterium]|nr:hypothetical protein [Prevotellaceae bacterium]
MRRRSRRKTPTIHSSGAVIPTGAQRSGGTSALDVVVLSFRSPRLRSGQAPRSGAEEPPPYNVVWGSGAERPTVQPSALHYFDIDKL